MKLSREHVEDLTRTPLHQGLKISTVFKQDHCDQYLLPPSPSFFQVCSLLSSYSGYTIVYRVREECVCVSVCVYV